MKRARFSRHRAPHLALAITLLLGSTPQHMAAQAGTSSFRAPAWAFPWQAPPAVSPADTVVRYEVPGSPVRLTRPQVNNAFDIPDWYPRQHPPMPSVVQYGVRPDGRACGYCHLPDGQGRPENATLAGLPEAYTLRQLRAYRDGSRAPAIPSGAPSLMATVSARIRDEQAREAARYFARLRLTRRNIIREVTQVPRTRIVGLLYALDGPGTEPLDGRLIEVPASLERHELRDPRVQYITYVPVGSVGRGRQLATRGPNGPATACATCHGPALLGMNDIPPIAGRSPSNLLRQLINFRTRARHDSSAAPMFAVADALTLDDMVALSAYVGGLPPSAPRQRVARPASAPRIRD